MNYIELYKQAKDYVNFVENHMRDIQELNDLAEEIEVWNISEVQNSLEKMLDNNYDEDVYDISESMYGEVVVESDVDVYDVFKSFWEANKNAKRNKF